MMMVIVIAQMAKPMSIQTCGLSECSNVGDFALEESLKTVDLVVLRITIRMIMVNVMIAIMIIRSRCIFIYNLKIRFTCAC